MRALVACVLCACSFARNGATPDSPPPGDAPSDMTIAMGTCFGSQGPGGFYFCIAQPPTSPLALSGTFDDTNTCPDGGFYTNLGPNNQKVCAFVGAGVTISQNFVMTGQWPIVIASTGDITISAKLDVSTSGGGQHGAGFNPPSCDQDPRGTSDAAGGGGGAGGSFVTQGGSGGKGGGGATGGAAPSAVTTPVATLRGGCPGGVGGDGNGNGTGGNAGYGGGAVFVVAYGTISITSLGTIDASGERGYHGHQGQNGANQGGGGSGAGSGGMIVIDAHVFAMSGKMLANGGGAGGGGDNNGDGNDGKNPDPTAPQTAATGGTGHGAGGDGGAGFAGGNASVGGMNANTNGGGGGGGGGAGSIRVLSGGVPAPSNSISPDATS